MTSRRTFAGFALADHLRAGAEAVPVPDSRPLGNWINLSSNELSHETVRRLFAEFIHEFDADRIARYPRHGEVRARTAAFFGVGPGELLFAPGSDAAIRIVLSHLIGAGGSLLVQWPNYRAYEWYAALDGAPAEMLPYLGRPAAEVAEDLLGRLEGRPPSMVALVNPNGYTGEVLPFAVMERIAEACHRHGHLLVIDEAYCAFNDFDHAALVAAFPNVLVIRSLSKGFGVAGLRLGVVLARQEIADYLRKTGIEDSVSAVTLGFWEHLMRNAGAVDEMRRDVRAIREWFAGRITAWPVFDSHANFLTIDFGDAATHAAAAAAMLANGYRVKSLDDIPQLANCLRITIAGRPVMEHVLEVLSGCAAAPEPAVR